MTYFLITFFLAYLLGSVPSAVWVGRAYHGVDVREHGSQNSGATNTFRVLGKRSGFLVLALDIMKGFTAANLVLLIPESNIMDNILYMKVILGLASVVGHIFPILAGFNGGKGIATLLGMVFAINPLIALGVILVFLFVLLATNLVSAGAIISTMSFAIFAWSIYGYDQPVLLVFGVSISLLVLITHRFNIKRILNGTEKKTFLFKSKDK
jgi:acyl phosphate:glycerol-3-phosphate acyltransferase